MDVNLYTDFNWSSRASPISCTTWRGDLLRPARDGIAQLKILMSNTLCPQSWRTSTGASLTASVLPPATTALSHHTEALRPKAFDSNEYRDGFTDKETLLLFFDVGDDMPPGQQPTMRRSTHTYISFLSIYGRSPQAHRHCDPQTAPASHQAVPAPLRQDDQQPNSMLKFI